MFAEGMKIQQSLVAFKRCHRHQMIVASYAETPIGVLKWLGNGTNKKSQPLGWRHEEFMSLA